MNYPSVFAFRELPLSESTEALAGLRRWRRHFDDLPANRAGDFPLSRLAVADAGRVRVLVVRAGQYAAGVLLQDRLEADDALLATLLLRAEGVVRFLCDKITAEHANACEAVEPDDRLGGVVQVDILDRARDGTVEQVGAHRRPPLHIVSGRERIRLAGGARCPGGGGVVEKVGQAATDVLEVLGADLPVRDRGGGVVGPVGDDSLSARTPARARARTRFVGVCCSGGRRHPPDFGGLNDRAKPLVRVEIVEILFLVSDTPLLGSRLAQLHVAVRRVVADVPHARNRAPAADDDTGRGLEMEPVPAKVHVRVDHTAVRQDDRDLDFHALLRSGHEVREAGGEQLGVGFRERHRVTLVLTRPEAEEVVGGHMCCREFVPCIPFERTCY